MDRKSVDINNQTLILGDSLEILPQLKDKAIFDACITDPPYNISGYDNKKTIGWLKSNDLWVGSKKFNKVDENWDKFSDKTYEKFTEKWLELVCKIVKPNGNIVVFGTYHNIFLLGYLLKRLNKRIINSVVWYKRNAFPNITQRMLCESTEYIIWAVNNDVKHAKGWTFNYKALKELNGGKQMRNVWDIPNNGAGKEKIFGKHPTQKPESIIERLVLGLTNKGDKIIDPFMGSGTTNIVSAKHSRISTGIEIEKKYYDIAVNRVDKFSKIFSNTFSFI